MEKVNERLLKELEFKLDALEVLIEKDLPIIIDVEQISTGDTFRCEG